MLITPALVEEMRARDDVVRARPHIYLPGSVNVSLQIGDRMLGLRVGEFIWGFSDPFTAPPELVTGAELADDAQGDIVVSASALEELGYGGHATPEGQATFDDVIGQEVALVLKAPRGDTQAFSFRVVGVLDTAYGAEEDFFGTHIAVADALALKAWWYNDPDILEHEGYDALTVKAASLNDAVQIVEQLQE